ncbi:zinc ribbon domain-containing protein [Okeania sp. SIO2B3]|uniref:zinc ribbon domain-containing protein n=1 Tax=Okeania sp. SIO2B3 TaxID=2607784 RepID=UPI003448B8F2
MKRLRQLEYKCQWYSCELVIVDRFFPSSKTCSNCGHKAVNLCLYKKVKSQIPHINLSQKYQKYQWLGKFYGL